MFDGHLLSDTVFKSLMVRKTGSFRLYKTKLLISTSLNQIGMTNELGGSHIVPHHPVVRGISQLPLRLEKHCQRVIPRVLSVQR